LELLQHDQHKADVQAARNTQPGTIINRDRMGAVAVSAFFHILATLGASLRVGRLSVVPTYDDVSYLVDGLHRLKASDVAGFRGLFRSLAPEKPAEIGSKMPKALIVDGIHPKSCRCHAPLLFTSGN
jgi:hypothetical protein